MIWNFVERCSSKNDMFQFKYSRALQVILLLTIVLQSASAFIFQTTPRTSEVLFRPSKWSPSLPHFIGRAEGRSRLKVPRSFLEIRMVKQEEQHQNGEIRQILKQCNFDKRLITLHKSELPVVGECYASGLWKLCIITGFKTPNSLKDLSSSSISTKEEIMPPLLEIITIDPGADPNLNFEKSVVDIGQITSVWKYPIKGGANRYVQYLSKALQKVQSSMSEDFLSSDGETIMQLLYKKKANSKNVGKIKGKGDPKSKSLTKKDINRISSLAVDGDKNYESHIQQILRKAVKAGLGDGEDGNGRLLDSLIVASSLSKGNIFRLGKDPSKTELLLLGASLLATDADLGGRFKRNPCIHVSTYFGEGGYPLSVEGVAFINGGWVAVDDTVRAGAEARKFAERGMANAATKSMHLEKSNDTKPNITPPVAFTAADERIMYRLECLAMGEELGGVGDEKELELDVRETLAAMSLEKSPEGAQEALVKIGRWSPLKKENVEAGRKGIQKMYSPWSSDILDCAKALRAAEEKRKEELYRLCSKNKSGKGKIEKRIDLTALPVVCIDAKRASFRDDAIGVRPRSSTGRRVQKGCKWELMVHIADVSVIYSPEAQKMGVDLDLSPLRRVAENRGASRYDLPLGPLHLMPPVALEALALATKRDGRLAVNRCVSLWVYIDDESGKILDAGLERTIIRKPVPLSFEEATAVFTSDEENLSVNAKQSKSLLLIIDRILSRWKENRLQSNEAARKREQRLQTREIVAKEMSQGGSYMRDDGARGSFQRSRGHKIVDNALDLHGSALSSLLTRAKAPIPRASGSGMDRGGRLGTAPLRRYIDGVAQRQALSVLCDYGGPPMSRKECSDANEIATAAINKINNLKSARAIKGSQHISNPSVSRNGNILQRQKALRALASKLAQRKGNKRIVHALSTGKDNEVVILGHGISVKCDGVKGTLKSGERVLVDVVKLDTQKSQINVVLVTDY